MFNHDCNNEWNYNDTGDIRHETQYVNADICMEASKETLVLLDMN